MIPTLQKSLFAFKAVHFGNAVGNSEGGENPISLRGNPHSKAAAESNPEKIRVLVVEDDIPIDAFLNKLPDIEATRVVSAQAGLEAYHRLKPDVVLLDESLEGHETGSSLFQKLLTLGAKASQFICISGRPPVGIYEPQGVPVYEDKCEMMTEISRAGRARREQKPELPTPIWDKWISTIRRLTNKPSTEQ